MNVTILTGPPAAGKNTIGYAYAKQTSKCVVIDVDLIRLMVVQPQIAPWEDEAGMKQLLLGAKNACDLVENFVEERYEVVILDVLSEQSAEYYKSTLNKFNAKIILLMPTFEEVQKRSTTRPPRLTDSEIVWVYKLQQKLTIFDEKIDNTNLEIADAVEKIKKINRAF